MSASLHQRRRAALDEDSELNAARKIYEGKVSGSKHGDSIITRIPEAEAWPPFARAINDAVDRAWERTPS